MSVRAIRAAVMAASLLSTIGFAGGAQATSFSIDTTVPGGSAWIDGSLGSIGGTVNVTSENVSEGALIGRINLHGLRSDTNAIGDLPVFCIDVGDWLGNGDFVEKPLSYFTQGTGGARVLYTSTQLQNMFKFLVYADQQGINDTLTSAATQLGVWEILNESGTSWDLNSGNLTVSLWSGPDAVSLANSWLGAFQSTSITNYQLHLLDPGRGNQLQAFITPGGNNNVQIPDVPEPTTWGMIVLGFGMLGSALRRRKPEQVLV